MISGKQITGYDINVYENSQYDVYINKIINSTYDIHLQSETDSKYNVYLQSETESTYKIIPSNSIIVSYDINTQKHLAGSYLIQTGTLLESSYVVVSYYDTLHSTDYLYPNGYNEYLYHQFDNNTIGIVYRSFYDVRLQTPYYEGKFKIIPANSFIIKYDVKLSKYFDSLYAIPITKQYESEYEFTPGTHYDGRYDVTLKQEIECIYEVLKNPNILHDKGGLYPAGYHEYSYYQFDVNEFGVVWKSIYDTYTTNQIVSEYQINSKIFVESLYDVYTCKTVTGKYEVENLIKQYWSSSYDTYIESDILSKYDVYIHSIKQIEYDTPPNNSYEGLYEILTGNEFSASYEIIPSTSFVGKYETYTHEIIDSKYLVENTVKTYFCSEYLIVPVAITESSYNVYTSTYIESSYCFLTRMAVYPQNLVSRSYVLFEEYVLQPGEQLPNYIDYVIPNNITSSAYENINVVNIEEGHITYTDTYHDSIHEVYLFGNGYYGIVYKNIKYDIWTENQTNSKYDIWIEKEYHGLFYDVKNEIKKEFIGSYDIRISKEIIELYDVYEAEEIEINYDITLENYYTVVYNIYLNQEIESSYERQIPEIKIYPQNLVSRSYLLFEEYILQPGSQLPNYIDYVIPSDVTSPSYENINVVNIEEGHITYTDTYHDSIHSLYLFENGYHGIIYDNIKYDIWLGDWIDSKYDIWVGKEYHGLFYDVKNEVEKRFDSLYNTWISKEITGLYNVYEAEETEINYNIIAGNHYTGLYDIYLSQEIESLYERQIPEIKIYPQNLVSRSYVSFKEYVLQPGSQLPNYIDYIIPNNVASSTYENVNVANIQEGRITYADTYHSSISSLYLFGNGYCSITYDNIKYNVWLEDWTYSKYDIWITKEYHGLFYDVKNEVKKEFDGLYETQIATSVIAKYDIYTESEINSQFFIIPQKSYSSLYNIYLSQEIESLYERQIPKVKIYPQDLTSRSYVLFEEYVLQPGSQLPNYIDYVIPSDVASSAYENVNVVNIEEGHITYTDTYHSSIYEIYLFGNGYCGIVYKDIKYDVWTEIQTEGKYDVYVSQIYDSTYEAKEQSIEKTYDIIYGIYTNNIISSSYDINLQVVLQGLYEYIPDRSFLSRYDIFLATLYEVDYDISISKIFEGIYEFQSAKSWIGLYNVYTKHEYKGIYGRLIENIFTSKYDILPVRLLDIKHDIWLESLYESEYILIPSTSYSGTYDVRLKKETVSTYTCIVKQEVESSYGPQCAHSVIGLYNVWTEQVFYSLYDVYISKLYEGSYKLGANHSFIIPYDIRLEEHFDSIYVTLPTQSIIGRYEVQIGKEFEINLSYGIKNIYEARYGINPATHFDSSYEVKVGKIYDCEYSIQNFINKPFDIIYDVRLSSVLDSEYDVTNRIEILHDFSYNVYLLASYESTYDVRLQKDYIGSYKLGPDNAFDIPYDVRFRKEFITEYQIYVGNIFEGYYEPASDNAITGLYNVWLQKTDYESEYRYAPGASVISKYDVRLKQEFEIHLSYRAWKEFDGLYETSNQRSFIGKYEVQVSRIIEGRYVATNNIKVETDILYDVRTQQETEIIYDIKLHKEVEIDYLIQIGPKFDIVYDVRYGLYYPSTYDVRLKNEDFEGSYIKIPADSVIGLYNVYLSQELDSTYATNPTQSFTSEYYVKLAEIYDIPYDVRLKEEYNAIYTTLATRYINGLYDVRLKQEFESEYKRKSTASVVGLYDVRLKQEFDITYDIGIAQVIDSSYIKIPSDSVIGLYDVRLKNEDFVGVYVYIPSNSIRGLYDVRLKNEDFESLFNVYLSEEITDAYYVKIGVEFDIDYRTEKFTQHEFTYNVYLHREIIGRFDVYNYDISERVFEYEYPVKVARVVDSRYDVNNWNVARTLVRGLYFTDLESVRGVSERTFLNPGAYNILQSDRTTHLHLYNTYESLRNTTYERYFTLYGDLKLYVERELIKDERHVYYDVYETFNGDRKGIYAGYEIEESSRDVITSSYALHYSDKKIILSQIAHLDTSRNIYTLCIYNDARFIYTKSWHQTERICVTHAKLKSSYGTQRNLLCQTRRDRWETIRYVAYEKCNFKYDFIINPKYVEIPLPVVSANIGMATPGALQPLFKDRVVVPQINRLAQIPLPLNYPKIDLVIFNEDGSFVKNLATDPLVYLPARAITTNTYAFTGYITQRHNCMLTRVVVMFTGGTFDDPDEYYQELIRHGYLNIKIDNAEMKDGSVLVLNKHGMAITPIEIYMLDDLLNNVVIELHWGYPYKAVDSGHKTMLMLNPTS